MTIDSFRISFQQQHIFLLCLLRLCVWFFFFNFQGYNIADYIFFTFADATGENKSWVAKRKATISPKNFQCLIRK